MKFSFLQMLASKTETTFDLMAILFQRQPNKPPNQNTKQDVLMFRKWIALTLLLVTSCGSIADAQFSRSNTSRKQTINDRRRNPNSPRTQNAVPFANQSKNQKKPVQQAQHQQPVEKDLNYYGAGTIHVEKEIPTRGFTQQQRIQQPAIPTEDIGNNASQEISANQMHDSTSQQSSRQIQGAAYEPALMSEAFDPNNGIPPLRKNHFESGSTMAVSELSFQTMTALEKIAALQDQNFLLKQEVKSEQEYAQEIRGHYDESQEKLGYAAEALAASKRANPTSEAADERA